MRTGKLLVWLAALGSVLLQTGRAEDLDFAVKIIDAESMDLGVHQDFRAVHLNGPVVEGAFPGSGQGPFVRRASLFDGRPIPITVRYSDSGGFPAIPDGADGSNRERNLREIMGQYSWRMAMGSAVLSAEQENTAKPGSVFKECANGCPVMIVIPPGSFIMGSPESEGSPEYDADHNGRERPQHQVALAKPFAISKFEVTFDDWDACTVAGACRRAPDSWGRGKMPVINVSWEDAKQYVAWLSHVTGGDYRLPSEAEWEYVARAGSGTRYSWGDNLGEGNANCDGCGSPWDLQQTAPAGSFNPNAFGLYDMHGNVWEWLEDSWHENYDGAPTDGSAWLRGGDLSYRIVRGGAWRNEGHLVRAALRDRRNIKVRFDTLGFRVARTLIP